MRKRNHQKELRLTQQLIKKKGKRERRLLLKKRLDSQKLRSWKLIRQLMRDGNKNSKSYTRRLSKRLSSLLNSRSHSPISLMMTSLVPPTKREEVYCSSGNHPQLEQLVNQLKGSRKGLLSWIGKIDSKPGNKCKPQKEQSRVLQIGRKRYLIPV